MNVLIAVMRSGTEEKLPRRIAWRVLIGKNASMRTRRHRFEIPSEIP
jgi:hypothetical protein